LGNRKWCVHSSSTILSDSLENVVTNAGGESDDICTIGDAFFYVTQFEYKFTCVGYGEETEECSQNNIVCAGFDSGYKVFGSEAEMASLLITASGQADHMYPDCPNGQ